MLEVDFSPYKNKKVVVALSGGADSVALFALFCKNMQKYGISLSALNVEHGIRGEESVKDSAFVKDLCARAGVPLSMYSADIPALAKEWGVGLEEAARRYRFSLYRKAIEEGGADFVATAHHASDNAESVLFNLFRGSALTGACGIRPFVPVCGEKGIVRPLLGVTKEEIVAFLTERGLVWREDSTNADTAYTRNYIRKNLLGAAKNIFPECEKSMASFSRLAREDDAFLYSLTDAYVSEGEEFVILPEAPRPVFLRCCMRAFRYFGAEKDHTLAAAEEIAALCGKESGTRADLPFGLAAVSDYGRIVVYRPVPSTAYFYPFGEGVFDCGKYLLRVARGVSAAEGRALGRSETDGDVQKSASREDAGALSVLYVDGKKIPAGAVIRRREEGDRFRKFGGGEKKLKEFFIDRKIPARERDFYPLVAFGKEIYAVCGAEISEKARAPRAEDGAFEEPQSVISLTLCKKEKKPCGKI